mgnify:CR=1 FL=1
MYDMGADSVLYDMGANPVLYDISDGFSFIGFLVRVENAKFYSTFTVFHF